MSKTYQVRTYTKKEIKNALGCSYKTMYKWLKRISDKLTTYVEGDRSFSPVDSKTIFDHFIIRPDENE